MHEVANDVGVCDCYGAAFCNLFLEDGYDAAIAAKHVAEARCDELRLGWLTICHSTLAAGYGLIQ